MEKAWQMQNSTGLSVQSIPGHHAKLDKIKIAKSDLVVPKATTQQHIC